MQRCLVVCWVALAACSDDDRNRTTPDTALVEVPAAVTNDNRVRIVFEARGNANNFFCTLDAGEPAPCISPFVADVADGEHTFAVAAALNANVDETPAIHAWRVDTVVPDTTITSAPPALDNSLTPQFAFTGSDGSTARAAGPVTFECSLDGGAFAPCTSPHTISNVVDGVHAFAVRSRDEAGNVDPTPATHGWTLDSTAPETAISAGPAAGATSGPSGSFAFTSPESPVTFECSVDGAAFAACTSPHAFVLGDGPHTFAVRAKDAVGTVDPSPAIRSWTVDAVAPPVTITATPSDPSNQATPAFSFTSTDATATFECQIDGVIAFTACTSPWTAPALADGTRTFGVRATDPYGNVGTPATFSWVVDRIPPTVMITSQPAALSNDSTPTVAFTTAGNPTTIECGVDGAGFAACTSPFTSSALADGTHSITIRATDAAGNQGSATTNMFVIDTVPPTVTILTQPAAISNDVTPTVTFSTAGNPTSTQCRVDAGAFADCTSGFTPTVAEGTHTITVRVTDAAGNSSSATTNMFTVDVTPPVVTITGAPAALSNDSTPDVVFTTSGSPVSVTCRLDAGTPVSCSSPHAFGVTADGAHTITVTATDAAGNVGSATTAQFTIDTVPPVLAFTSQPPASWPVDYYDFAFTVGDSASVTCRLDGGAPAPCASPHTVQVTYGAVHTLEVRGVDAANNAASISATWTPQRGLVLHYPWEQGDTDNTSLLKQRPAMSPDGVTPTIAAFVGGWAGSALGSTVSAHQYANTRRPLSSAPDGTYAASFWIRSTDAASAQAIFSTVNGTSGGLRVALTGGSQLSFTAFEAGASVTNTTSIAEDRWVHIGMRTTGPGKGLEVFIDGNSRISLSSISGFNAGQAANLTVGAWQGLDVDDLRFYNQAFSNGEMCTVLARGTFGAAGPCVPLSPGFEIDFEGGRVSDTGVWGMALVPPTGPTELLPHTLGDMFRLLATALWGYDTGNQPTTFPQRVAAITGGRSFTLSFTAGSAFGRLVDFTRPCLVTGGGGLCGIAVTYPDNNSLQIYSGTPSQQKTTTITSTGGLAPGRFNNVVVTEQRDAQGATTSLTVFVNMVKTAIPISGGDIYAIVDTRIDLVGAANLIVDEYEFWPTDLQTSLEMLCENGADGEFDVVTNSCLLTAGP